MSNLLLCADCHVYLSLALAVCMFCLLFDVCGLLLVGLCAKHGVFCDVCSLMTCVGC